MSTFWDERFDRVEYVYGTEPNEFVAENFHNIPAGRVLCIGEGEGRNAVFLAEKGYEVTAVDASSVGLLKAQKLAAERGVTVHTVHADLAHYRIEPKAWQGIVSIFCHLPQPLRQSVHRACVHGLDTGGFLLLEAFTPKQLEYKTGGPTSLEMLMTLETLQEECRGLDFIIGQEVVRNRQAGLFHTGLAAVVQVLAQK